ncbi:MAG: efflux RND transporter periplasmic adaptor subunit [Burkholderiaceae bacterium]
MRSIRRLTHIATALLILSSIAGCGAKTDNKPAAGGVPPPEVSVITIAPAPITLVTELPGRLEATRIAQVRARVPGIVLKRTFEEGREVKAGDLLFQIDPTPFQTTYNSAQAAQAKAEANLAQANLKVERYKPLVETNAISKQEYDDALTAQKQTAADVAAAKATQENARLNLTYASVTAPISGQIGRALGTEGALVGQGEATPLALIQQLDPIYVNLTQSSTDLMRLRRAISSGKLKGSSNQVKVSLVTEDGNVYPQPGKLLFSDISVDESSGSIMMRASFPNPDRTLLPGMYVRARLDQAVNENAITVPQQAVIRGTDGASVLLVDKDGKVTPQPVQADTAQDNKWVISKGLKAGDQVIVEGFQKAKPGATVKPVAWQAAPQADQKSKTN